MDTRVVQSTRVVALVGKTADEIPVKSSPPVPKTGAASTRLTAIFNGPNRATLTAICASAYLGAVLVIFCFDFSQRKCTCSSEAPSMAAGFKNAIDQITTACRCWYAYQGLIRELSSASDQVLAELGTRRSDIYDFAWQCARLATHPPLLPAAHRLRPAGE